MKDPHSFCMLTALSGANKARNHFWDPESKLTPLFFSTELAGEVGEACNVVKKLEREKLGLRGSTTTVGALAEELADAVICASLLANCYDIDLREAVRNKFNSTSDKLNLPVRITNE